ncbi:MAG: lipase family protein [Beijerinckiaceae bacterium]|nr:lipase family protein [Beijerinckiaceae bacterium]
MPPSQSSASVPQGQGVSPASLPNLRAAYSDRSASLMARLAEIAYDSSIETVPSASVPPRLSSLGFTEAWSFYNGLTDGWAYIALGPELAAVAFRGTDSVEDWKTNFRAALVHPEGTDDKLLVHEGFYSAFRKLSDGNEGLGSRLGKIKSETAGKLPIYITGHSLGGALAQIASAVFGDDQIAACYTFGSPRVGNPQFDLWVKVPSYRVINHADIVPQVPPPWKYRHSGDPRYLPEQVTGSPYRFEPPVYTRAWQFVRGTFEWVFNPARILAIADHSIGEYSRKLGEIAAGRSQGR